MVLNRNLIHSDFILYPHRIKREDFFVRIDLAKSYLLSRFKQGMHITIGCTNNDVKSLAFIFACFELGITIKIMSEPFFCGPEFDPERFEHLLTLLEDYSTIDGEWILDGMVNDRDDPILGGKIGATKRDIFGSSFQKLINEMHIPNYYMGDYEFASPLVHFKEHHIESTDNATSYFAGGDWLSVPPIEFKTHEYILDKVESQHISFENKVVGLTKNIHHDNALERLILPALMQSSKLVDFQIPDEDYGGFFITNDKISAEKLFEYTLVFGHRLIDVFGIDIIMAPSDDTLWKFLDYRAKSGQNFNKTLEIILHDEITDKHREWESKLDVKFLI